MGGAPHRTGTICTADVLLVIRRSVLFDILLATIRRPGVESAAMMNNTTIETISKGNEQLAELIFLGKPQSWVYNCETANRRVDVAEFADWCVGCGVKPQTGFLRFLQAGQ